MYPVLHNRQSTYPDHSWSDICKDIKQLLYRYIDRVLINQDPYIQVYLRQCSKFCELLPMNARHITYLDESIELFTCFTKNDILLSLPTRTISGDIFAKISNYNYIDILTIQLYDSPAPWTLPAYQTAQHVIVVTHHPSSMTSFSRIVQLYILLWLLDYLACNFSEKQSQRNDCRHQC